MHTVIVLDIIKLSLEITLEVIKGIPIESRQKMWEEHEKRLEFWQGLLKKVSD